MAAQDNAGGSSAHGQFILDFDLHGPGLTEDQARELANALATPLAALAEKVTQGACALKGAVLCGWRVWGGDEPTTLPRHSVWIPYMRMGKDTPPDHSSAGVLLPAVRADSEDLDTWGRRSRDFNFGVCAVCGGLHDKEINCPYGRSSEGTAS